MNFARLNLQQRIAAGAAAVVLVSAFLPWVSFLGFSALGIEGDGKLTFIFALAGLALLAVTAGVFQEPKFAGKGADISLLVLGGLTALIGLIDTLDAGSLAAFGLYFTLLGGLAWAGAATWHFLLAHTTVLSGEKGPQGPA